MSNETKATPPRWSVRMIDSVSPEAAPVVAPFLERLRRAMDDYAANERRRKGKQGDNHGK